jgi:beta-lactamase class A
VEAVGGLLFTRPPAASAPVAPAHHDTRLQVQVEAVAVLAGGTAAVVVRDLRGGATAVLHDEREFTAASLFKLPILVEVLKQARLGRLDLDAPLEIVQRHWTSGSGVLQARVGDRLPARELLKLMIGESDNIASLVLLDAVGVDQVNATLEAMGLQSTRLRDREQDPSGHHVTSARDMATLLEVIAAGELIDAQTSEEALRLLEMRQANAWLTDELPWWVKLAHKWGDLLPRARHDAGIIFAPDKTYVAVVLTEGGSPEAAQRVIANVSRTMFEHLSQ